jgi:hypothetical protein
MEKLENRIKEIFFLNRLLAEPALAGKIDDF